MGMCIAGLVGASGIAGGNASGIAGLTAACCMAMFTRAAR
jgi:hypothetical protein